MQAPPGSGGMPPGGFNIPPPPFPPHQQQQQWGGNGPAGGHMYTDSHQFNPNFAGNFNAQAHAEKQMAAMRRVRNIRAGLAIITFICLSKITVDSRRLYAEEKGLLDTLVQADKDCNNNASIATIEANPSSSRSSATATSSAASSSQPMLSNVIRQTSYTEAYCYAAEHFPMATVRHVVISALGEYETRLAKAIETSRLRRLEKEQQQNQEKNNNKKQKGSGGNDATSATLTAANLKPASNEELMAEFNSLPRHVPARLFGGSVEQALRRSNMTSESVARGIPCLSNEEAGVGRLEHMVLRSMLRIGQAASFEGFGKSIWERKMEELRQLQQKGE